MSANRTAGSAATKTAAQGDGPRPGGANVRSMSQHLAHYLQKLELPPGASLDEINTSYYTIVRRFPGNPTEEDETRMQELRRAYEMLRRAYVPPGKATLEVRFDRRRLVGLLGLVAAVGLGGFLYMNRGTIRVKMTHYEAGEVLRLNTAAVPFGTVVGYEPAHRFPAGAPGAAYEIRLDGKQETIWISDRMVVNGMSPASK